MRKKILLHFVTGWLSMTVYSQTAVHINVVEQHQTIQGIGASGHGYWTDTSAEEIISIRQAVAQKAAEQGIELYQTEYCLLSNDYDHYLSNSILVHPAGKWHVHRLGGQSRPVRHQWYGHGALYYKSTHQAGRHFNREGIGKINVMRTFTVVPLP